MAYTIIPMFARAFGAVVGWYESVVSSTGMIAFILPMLVVYLSVRYLLSPLMFSAGSDSAKRKKGGENNG